MNCLSCCVLRFRHTLIQQMGSETHVMRTLSLYHLGCRDSLYGLRFCDSSSSALSVISLGSPFWVRCLRMLPFFNPTIELVTYCLHGWCMLGVFLLPAFTHLGREYQDLFESV